MRGRKSIRCGWLWLIVIFQKNHHCYQNFNTRTLPQCFVDNVVVKMHKGQYEFRISPKHNLFPSNYFTLLNRIMNVEKEGCVCSYLCVHVGVRISLVVSSNWDSESPVLSDSMNIINYPEIKIVSINYYCSYSRHAFVVTYDL